MGIVRLHFNVFQFTVVQISICNACNRQLLPKRLPDLWITYVVLLQKRKGLQFSSQMEEFRKHQQNVANQNSINELKMQLVILSLLGNSSLTIYNQRNTRRTSSNFLFGQESNSNKSTKSINVNVIFMDMYIYENKIHR